MISFIAENRDAAIGLLRGGKPGKKSLIESKTATEEKKASGSGRKTAKSRKTAAVAKVA